MDCTNYFLMKGFTVDATSIMSKFSQFLLGWIKAAFLTILISHFMVIPLAVAAPQGGNIVGGSGSIKHYALTTTIKQNTSSLAINWNSFNLSQNEIVNFLQPGTSSIALNRVLSNSGSQILGQINANGHVVLVNPNGIFFGASSSVNVGGLIASGLDIDPVNFMNGNYLFKALEGTNGSVINSGLLNASLGGSISLLGKQVENNGLIVAKLGTVNLAAGKEAILTFDDVGLVGVRISKEILQDELGVNPGILNSGEIKADGGRVLLTASTSRDFFSQAVNSGSIEQATSVTVYDDGTFTLGGGADVVNSGIVNVSTTGLNQDAGQVVVLGENITSSGLIKADSISGQGGDIELHALDKIELIEDAIVSAISEVSGTGGQIKLLGDKVGLLDNSMVDVSGANGGGEALIGGDKQGENPLVRNASFLFMAENANVNADALVEGSGGKIITYAEDTARIYGNLFARGGASGGDGGFIETSGKRGFTILNAPDVSASSGKGGLWLIDPYNITIESSGEPVSYNVTGSTIYTSAASSATISVDTIVTALGSGDVAIVTGVSDPVNVQEGDIIFDDDFDYNGIGDRTLTLEAANNITFSSGKAIGDGDPSSQDSLNLNLFAKGAIILNDGVSIETNGGNFTVGFDDTTTTNDDFIPTSFTSYSNISGNISRATIDTSGADFIDNTTVAIDAGSITIMSSGAVSVDDLIAKGGTTQNSSSGGNPLSGGAGGDVTIIGTSVSVQAIIDTSGASGRYDSDDNNGHTGGNGGNGGFVKITSSTGDIIVDAINTQGGVAAGTYNSSGNGPYLADGGDAGKIDLITSGSGVIILNGDLTAAGARGYIDGASGSHGDGGDITLDGDVLLAADIIIDATAATDGTVDIPGTDGDIDFNKTIAGTSDRSEDLTLSGGAINFGTSTVVGSVGTTSIHLNDLDITATGDVNVYGDQYLSTLNVDSLNYDTHSKLIDTSESSTGKANSATEGFVTINVDEALKVGNIDTFGADATTGDHGRAGGNVVLTGAAITTGNIQTYGTVAPANNRDGGQAGSVTIMSTGTLNTASVVNVGSIIANGGDGGDDGATGGLVEITATGTATASPIITIVGSTNTSGGNGNTGGSSSGSHTGAAAGSISITATSISGATTGSIINLEGDFESAGGAGTAVGTSQTAEITLAGAINSTVNIAFDSGVADNFTSSVNITGSNNSDEIKGSDRLNVWGINDSDAGTLNNNLSFTDIENLTGGTAADTFNIIVGPTAIGSIDGLIEGGSGAGTDTLNLFIAETAATTDTSVQLTTTGVLENAILEVNNVEEIHANALDNNTLSGTDSATSWFINAVNSGSLGGTSLTTVASEGEVIFTNFKNLSGGTNVDNFKVEAGGNITGLIDGGSDGVDGTTNDSLDLSAKTIGTSVQLAATVSTLTPAVFNVSNIETLLGGTASNTLIGSDLASTWIINDANEGAVGSDAALASGIPVGTVEGVTKFTDFNIFNGGSTADSFHINGANVIATIDGGAGIDELMGHDIANTWSIKALDSTLISTGTVTFNAIENITGGSLDDTFTIESNASVTGLIDGGNSAGGVDSVSITIATPVTVSLNALDTGATLRLSNIEQVDALAGNNILVADNADNNWIIDAQNNGAVGSATTFTQDSIPLAVQGITRFSNFGTLTGGTGADKFVITTPTIGTAMTLNGGVSFAVTSYDSLNLGNATTSFNVDSVWEINNVDSGIVNSPDILTPTLSINFNGIENLSGGTADDVFKFTDIGSLRGLIDGGANTTTSPGDTVDYSDLTNTILLAFISDPLNATDPSVDQIYVNNIETIKGNGGSFTGAAGTNDWFIETDSSGYVENNGVRINYTGVDSLIGNTGVDNFAIIDDIVFLGSLDGGDGDDTLTAFATAALGGNVWNDITANSSGSGMDGELNTDTTFTGIETLTGNTINDTFNLSASNLTGTINGGAGVTGIDRLNAAATSNDNVWNLINSSDGSLNTNLNYFGMESIDGSSTAIDTINSVAGTNIWNISDNGIGDLNSASLNFIEMDVFNGNIGDDTFTLSALVTQGTFNGYDPLGAGIDTGTDVLNAAALVGGNSWVLSTDNDGTLNSTIIFNAIETINGNSTVDTLNVAIGNNAWNIVSNGTGDLNSAALNFTGMENLVGNDGTDNFTLLTELFTGSINGGDGIDSLTASAGNNSWIINGPDSGTVAAESTPLLTASFSFIENLIGNTGDDTFNIADSGEVSGTIDGGTGIDQLDLTTKSSSVTVKLGSPFLTSATTAEYFSTNNLETVDAPIPAGSISNTLIGADVEQLWIIDNIDSGAVGDVLLINNGIPSGDTEGITKFSSFDNVVGGIDDDSFRFIDPGSITTSLLGGDHVNGDTIDKSQQAVVEVIISSGSTGFDEVEGFRGNNTNSTLIASNNSNEWTITGHNDGIVVNTTANPDTSFTFEDFNILKGGSLDDQFIVDVGGSVSDLTNNSLVASGIYGGDGNDSLTVNLNGTDNARIALFDGGDGNDTVTFQDDSSGTTGFDLAVFTPDIASNTVTYSYQNNTPVNKYDITYENTETVLDNVSADKLIISGSSVDDVILLSSIDYTVSSISVDYTNKSSIDVVASGGADSIELASNIDLGIADLLLETETINAGGFLITANNLTLDTVQSTTLALQTDVTTLAITNSASSINNIMIEEQGAIELTDLEFTGVLNIQAADDISQSLALSSTAALQLTSANGDILLGETANALSGSLSLSAINGVIDLSNTVTTDLAAIDTTSLTINSTADITDSGTVVANNVILDSGSSLILLDSTDNDFDTFSIINATSVDITDNDDIILAGISMGSGTLTINTATGISQTGAITQASGAGTATFNAGAGIIELNQSNDFTGDVSLNNTGAFNVVLSDQNAIQLASSNVGSGLFTINATTGITQTGEIIQEVNLMQVQELSH